MAFSIGSSDDADMEEISDINVTPFIDVILVLLIIFMVAAPLSTVDVPVDLPAAGAPPSQRPEKPVYVTLKSDLSLTVGETGVDWPLLGSSVDAATNGKRETRIFVRADKTVPYGEIMRLFDQLRANGFLKTALVALERGGAQNSAQPQPSAGSSPGSLPGSFP